MEHYQNEQAGGIAVFSFPVIPAYNFDTDTNAAIYIAENGIANAVIHDSIEDFETGETVEFVVFVTSSVPETDLNHMAGYCIESMPSAQIIMWLDLHNPHTLPIMSKPGIGIERNALARAIIEATGLSILQAAAVQAAG